MKFENVIWEGRYQPIHKGHLAYIKLLLRHAEHLTIFVVENGRSTELGSHFVSPVPEFTKIVDKHHSPEKNPLPFWLRYRLVIETIKSEIGDDAPVTIWGGKRLDFLWDFYSNALPPNRVFITPKRDGFEDAKAFAWKKLREKVIRIDVDHLPKISATMIRENVSKGKSTEELLCPETERLLKHYGYYDKLNTFNTL